MLYLSYSHNLARLNATLEAYAVAAGKGMDEVLEKKGRDLGIRLFRGYRARRWKGSRKGQGGIAWREMRQRAKRGEGITLRPGIEPLPEAPQTYLAYRTLRGAHGTLRKLLVPHRTSEHQKRVFAELMMRQRGIGVLAASFLWYRRRRSKTRGTYFVRNKTGRPLGYVEKGEGYLRIVGQTDGLRRVNERYGIVVKAIADVEADTRAYVERKHRESWARAAGRAA